VAEAVVPVAEHPIARRRLDPLGEQRAQRAVEEGVRPLPAVEEERQVERRQLGHPVRQVARREVAHRQLTALDEPEQRGRRPARGDDVAVELEAHAVAEPGRQRPPERRGAPAVDRSGRLVPSEPDPYGLHVSRPSA
jgi:hypothetical protein